MSEFPEAVALHTIKDPAVIKALVVLYQHYCVESGREWDEGLTFLMFIARESMQESTRFSSAKLVFEHTICSPLKMLSEHLLTTTTKTKLCACINLGLCQFFSRPSS